LRKKVIFLGLSGFPFGMAAISKQKLLAKSLINAGWEAHVINKRSVHQKKREIEKKGNVEGILYTYLYNPYRQNNFVLRNLQKLFSPVLEFIELCRIKRKTKFFVAVVSNSNMYFNSVGYYLMSRIIGFKLIHNTAELYINRSNTGIKRRLNDKLFNKYGLYFYDGYIPISQAIINYFKIKHRVYHYIPTITDISAYDSIKIKAGLGKYFLFCGSAAYYTAVEFIINAFKLSNLTDHTLILVTGGSMSEINKIRDKIAAVGLENKIEIKSGIPDKELLTYYKSAIALLLPMFETIQDKARFPHKLSEYLASETVVLSSPVGEVGHHLTHSKNVLFSPPDDVDKFAENMRWVNENTDDAKNIGISGRQFCEKKFNYYEISNGFSDFLLKLFRG
jgi:glycosyltransferase involved in cell wall biosynthesis